MKLENGASCTEVIKCGDTSDVGADLVGTLRTGRQKERAKLWKLCTRPRYQKRTGQRDNFTDGAADFSACPGFNTGPGKMFVRSFVRSGAEGMAPPLCGIVILFCDAEFIDVYYVHLAFPPRKCLFPSHVASKLLCITEEVF